MYNVKSRYNGQNDKSNTNRNTLSEDLVNLVIYIIPKKNSQANEKELMRDGILAMLKWRQKYCQSMGHNIGFRT